MTTANTQATGIEGFDGADLVIPTRAIFQNTTSVEGIESRDALGYFYDRQHLTVHGGKMKVVVLSAKKLRNLFWDKNNPQTNPQGLRGKRCYSLDGKTPAADVQNPVSATCAGCEFEQRDSEYHLLCYDVDGSKQEGYPVVFYYIAKGKSAFPTRQYVGGILQRKRNIRDFLVNLESLQDKNGKGNYYKVQFTGVQAVPDDLKDEIETAYQMYAGGGATVDSDEPF